MIMSYVFLCVELKTKTCGDAKVLTNIIYCMQTSCTNDQDSKRFSPLLGTGSRTLLGMVALMDLVSLLGFLELTGLFLIRTVSELCGGQAGTIKQESWFRFWNLFTEEDDACFKFATVFT